MPIVHGFRLLKEDEIKELRTQSRFFRHEKTGAELLSLTNDDENKVFGITFRTPAPDSTGVAHILEHSVLCGSRKYPVKEPFVELLKGSLQTFLNAFTYPDKTCYPVASQNLKDFYNLVDVYLDAVFHPRLTSPILQQEGWHYELQKPENPLTYKGVVFNEMKGAYSSPENLLSEYSLQSLFPDNPYGLDSGGHPTEIPNLTFEQFQAFHRKYYHPSNARIFFCGDDDPDERLRLLDVCLKDFEARPVASQIPLQPRFEQPRHLVREFVVGDEEGAEPKGMVTVNWMLDEGTETETNFALRILDYILLGMPASPLRKALIDSGLGEDLAGDGLGTELRQIYFSTGLKGMDVQNAEAAETLVMETLAALAREGIDPQTVEAALNTIEFRLRENNTGSYPRGLSLMLRSLTTWLYDADPLSLLRFEKPLAAVKSRARTQKSFFEELIERFFLKNPHRTTLVLRPDRALREKQELAEKERLAEARSTLSAEALQAVVDNTLELRRLQETPDPPEALAKIPMLGIADLDKENKTIPTAVNERQEAKFLFHDLFTNGIVYLDIGFDLHTLPDRYLPYVPLLGRAFVEMGTEKENFVALTQRISRTTGGIAPETITATVRTTRLGSSWLFLRGKAMSDQAHALTEILHDVLHTVRLDNQERFRQMLLEEKARQEQMLIPGGHRAVNLRLRAHFGEASWAAEQMGGISYLFFLRNLAEAVENNWTEVLEALEAIRRTLVNRNTMICNLTTDEPSRARFEPHLDGLLAALPSNRVARAEWSRKLPESFEGMIIPSQVNYVGKGANLYDLGYGFSGASMVITRYLRTAWLWERIRVQGGAYGAFCLFDRLSGILTFVSYRDPNLLETLDAFDHTSEFLRDLNLNDDERTKSIIGAVGDLDAYMLPDAKGFFAMLLYLSGDTEETRQQMRNQILGTQASDFRAFGEVLEEVRHKGIVKVLGSPSAIEAATTQKPDWLTIFKVL